MNCRFLFVRFFLFLIVLAFPCIVQSQDTLTLQQCLLRAIEQNFDLKILQNQAAIAAHNATRENAGYLPVVTANATADGSFMQWKEASHGELYGANVAAEWTVYDGNKRAVTYKWLQELKAKSDLEVRLSVEALVAEVATIYYNLVQHSLRIQNLGQSMILSHHRLKIAQENFYVGMRSRLEVLQAEVDFNADSSDYVIYKEETRQLKIKLKQLLQIPYERAIYVADNAIDLRRDLEKEDLIAKAMANNITLLMSDKDRSLSALELRQTKSTRYPYIHLNSSYGYSGVPYEDDHAVGLKYGATVGVNIYDGGKQRRLERNAVLQQQNKDFEYQKQQQQVLADISLLYSSYKTYLALLNLEKLNSDLATEKVDLAIEQYQQGQLSSLEMREFQRTLLDAQDRFVTALYQAKYAEIRLLQLCSMTQEYF
jgi:outer membrane protein TolC